MSGARFGTTMPGGFSDADVTLARNPAVDYGDLAELSTFRFRGVGGRIAWEGRLESSPRTSGDQMQIAPGLVGYQSHLDDDASVRIIFVDIDLSRWQGPSIQRQINLLAASVQPSGSMDIEPDPSGDPAVATYLTGPWTGRTRAEMWYDAGAANLIASVYYAFKLGSTTNINAADANWQWTMGTSTDDVATSFSETANLRAASGAGYFTPGTSRRYAYARHEYLLTTSITGSDFKVFWGPLAAYGGHGLSGQGTDPVGFLSSDIEAYTIQRWAPQLTFTKGTSGTIQPSAFTIPHLVFYDPTTASAIIKAATQFEDRDWAIWENQTYYSNARGARGRKWVARSTDCKLQATGPQIARLYNGALVTFQDSAGATRLCGPPGSGADVEDSRLLDPDPLNPANELGIKRYGPDPPISIGIGDSDGAVLIGANYLQDQKDLDHSGQASHVGYVQEYETGVPYPAYVMRGGDQVMYVDASDHSFRRIVSTDYNDASISNAIQLDAPPETLQALLARYGVELTNS